MRYAIFVDAGYLYAQGSVVLTGNRRQRRDLALDLPAAKERLLCTASKTARGADLLRIYWYDGAPGGRMTPEHTQLAGNDDIKLRLGAVNEAGQQKGVDALIFMDMVELARNHAISDALLLSGDEDLRVGVQIAQSFGIRVHLIGIEPSRSSQSIPLMQEADTTTEWSKGDIARLMSVPALEAEASAIAAAYVPSPPGDTGLDAEDSPGITTLFSGDREDPYIVMEGVVAGYVAELGREDIETILELDRDAQIPSHIDRVLLAICAKALNDMLTSDQKYRMRQLLRERARERAKGT